MKGTLRVGATIGVLAGLGVSAQNDGWSRWIGFASIVIAASWIAVLYLREPQAKELDRQMLHEAITAAFGISFAMIFAYALLQPALDLPDVDPLLGAGLMVSTLFIASLIALWRYR